MSQENVDIVHRLFDAFNAFMQDELSSQAYAELFDPQIELRRGDRRVSTRYPV